MLARVVDNDRVAVASAAAAVLRARLRDAGDRLARERLAQRLRGRGDLCAQLAGHGSRVGGQRLSRVGTPVRPHLGRRAGADNLPAAIPALRSQINDPVGGADHVQIVLDHQQRMSGRQQLAERVEQLRDVLEVQTRGGLIEQKKLAVVSRAGDDRAGLGEVAGKLQPLRFAARQGRHRLAELHVLEPHVGERRKARSHIARVREECQRLRDRHVQYVGNAGTPPVRPFALDLEHLVAIAAPVAVRATQVYVREELHLDVLEAVAAARRAAAVARVEAERAGGVLALLGGRLGSEQCADRIERAHVARGVRARRAADRTLIDHHHIVEQLRAAQPGEFARRLGRLAPVFEQCGVEHVLDQSGFAGA